MKNRVLKWLWMTAAIVGLVASPSLAHGGGAHLMGVVSTITKDEIVVKDADGHESKAKITPETRFLRGKEVGHQEDLHPGDRVGVHGHKEGAVWEASEIHYAAAK